MSYDYFSHGRDAPALVMKQFGPGDVTPAEGMLLAGKEPRDGGGSRVLFKFNMYPLFLFDSELYVLLFVS